MHLPPAAIHTLHNCSINDHKHQLEHCVFLRLGMVWLPAAVGHIMFPWQLSATRRATMAVLPKPMLPMITTPWLLVGSPLRRWASTSWKSHSLPLNSQSDESPGISKCRGFRLREGVKETVGNRIVVRTLATFHRLCSYICVRLPLCSCWLRLPEFCLGILRDVLDGMCLCCSSR